MVDEQVQEQPQDVVSRAEQAVARLEAKLAETKALLEKNQELETRRILGGQTQVQQEVKKELTPKEYKDLVMSGGYKNV